MREGEYRFRGTLIIIKLTQAGQIVKPDTGPVNEGYDK